MLIAEPLQRKGAAIQQGRLFNMGVYCYILLFTRGSYSGTGGYSTLGGYV